MDKAGVRMRIAGTELSSPCLPNIALNNSTSLWPSHVRHRRLRSPHTIPKTVPRLPREGGRLSLPPQSPPLAEFQFIFHILMDCVEGEKSLPNGDLYIGSLFGSLPAGRGKYLWLNGCMYEGMWCKGKKMGKGKVSWPSGSTYEGEFMGGCLHGYGTFTGVNGGTYKGHWVLNQMHGVGKKCYTNGDIYEGQWQHGLQEGDGRYMWVNGDEYIGQWRVGKMCGKGTMKWSNGDKYDGLWQDGLQHGQGLYRWSLHGSLYVGTWNMGLKEGKGIFYPNMCPTQDEVYYSPARGGDFDRDSHSSSVSDLESLASFHGSSFDGTPSRTFISRRMNSFDTENTEDSSVSDPSVNSLDEFEEAGSSVGDTSEESLSLVVEREYSQGVLVHEFVKENVPVKGSKKQKKVYKEGKKQGETIFKGHRNYDLMLSLQLGIRYTVGRITPEPKRGIVTADFGPKAKICMRFPPEGSASTPPHQSTEFKWKDYCPLVFRHLRELFNIDAADYMLSICGSNALREFSSPGKSGSLFYMSHDDSFMIKTMRKSEVKVLLRMLPNYYNHVRTYQNTLITRFFGVHAIKPTGGQKIRFVVMHNMFCSDLRIHRRFDLKGSSQGRSTHKTEIEETTTLKDLDLDFVFHVEPSWRRELIKQIEMDCKLLAKEKIMDYSLLLGVHIRSSQSSTMFSPARVPDNFSLTQNKMSTLGGYNKRGIPDADDPDFDSKLHVRLGVNMPARAVQKQSKNKQSFQHEPEEYEVVLYFGIIDILQEYDVSKKLEHAYKALQFDAFTISSVDPKQYSKRFREFISKVFPA